MLSVSVVIPSFNQGRWLEACLASVLSQSGPMVEAIVIDGGSTDESTEILKRYADRLAYWVSEKDRGQTHALIKGFVRSRGEVMAWLNSDDYYEPGALGAVAEAFERHPEADVIYGDMRWVDPEGRPLKVKREIDFDLGIFLWDYNYLPQPSTFWRRRIWEASGGLDESLQCAMDYDLWLKFVRAGARFIHVPTILSNMRTYPEQKNQRLRRLSDAEDRALRERFLGRRIPGPERWLKYPLHKARRLWRKLKTT